MSIPGSASPLFLASTAAAAGGYDIPRSLRFNSGDSAYLNRTPSSAGNRRTFTFSFWAKLGDLAAQKNIITASSTPGASNASSPRTEFRFTGNGGILFATNITGSSWNSLSTTAVFRDPSAWYHVVVAVDTTQATESNRVKIYVNGVQELWSGSVAGQNDETPYNNTYGHAIGAYANNYNDFFDGYLAEFISIDGQALAPSDFGEYDDNNVWQPKEYAGTYGTNGFKLDFSDTSSDSALGTDSSGEGNDWSVNNLSVAAGAGNDALRDSPTNGTQIDTGVGGEVVGNYATLNPLHVGHSTLTNGNLDASGSSDLPTIIPGSGQWYYEIGATGYNWDGTAANFTSAAGSYNFGQRPFSGTPNSGYKALCTANLPDPTIADGSTAFDAKAYAGTGSALTITGMNLSPDLIWIKDRGPTPVSGHKLEDAVRGAGKYLSSNTTGAEVSPSNGVTSFNSDGFTLGTDNAYNDSGHTFIAWTWDGGSSTVTNTDGSISSQVRANPSAGFSIVKFAMGSGSYTVGHGLGAAPSLLITKSTSNTSSWWTYHESLGTGSYLALNSSAAAATDYSWGAAPTSTVLTANNNFFTNGYDYIAYCFAPVEGYSSFGSYAGNSSADGPFVFTGFRPRWILLKNSTNAYSWYLYDTARGTYNVVETALFPDSAGEDTVSDAYAIDILSNGFKLRNSNIRSNGSSNTYIYAAFAEHPFKTARAR